MTVPCSVAEPGTIVACDDETTPVVIVATDTPPTPPLPCEGICGPADVVGATTITIPDECLPTNDRFNPGVGTMRWSLQPCVVDHVPTPLPAEPARAVRGTSSVAVQVLPETGAVTTPVLYGGTALILMGVLMRAFARRRQTV